MYFLHALMVCDYMCTTRSINIGVGDNVCRYDAVAPSCDRRQPGGRHSSDPARGGSEQAGRRLVDATARSVFRGLRRDSQVWIAWMVRQWTLGTHFTDLAIRKTYVPSDMVYILNRSVITTEFDLF